MTKIRKVSYEMMENKASLGCVRTGSDNACVRARVVATNSPFVKLMEIAESVPTGRVRQRLRAL